MLQGFHWDIIMIAIRQSRKNVPWQKSHQPFVKGHCFKAYSVSFCQNYMNTNKVNKGTKGKRDRGISCVQE